jgi:hypothetical protein
LYELQFAEEEEGDGATGQRSDGAKKQSGI